MSCTSPARRAWRDSAGSRPPAARPAGSYVLPPPGGGGGGGLGGPPPAGGGPGGDAVVPFQVGGGGRDIQGDASNGYVIAPQPGSGAITDLGVFFPHELQAG